MVYQILLCSMNYQALSIKHKGFSLIEIIVVLGIISILAGISVVGYTRFRSQSNLEIATGIMVQALRFAKSNSEQVNNNSNWGVYVNSEEITVFSGTNYASRDTSKDKKVLLPSGVTVSGLSEIIFEKVSGSVGVTGSIIITSPDTTKNISINEKGTITY